MAFGLIEGVKPVDMLVGAGNAYVAEAKRQLFGRVGIDLLAGPTEILVIADDRADPHLVAADLLGQAEHGPDLAAGLIAHRRGRRPRGHRRGRAPARDLADRRGRRRGLARARLGRGRRGRRRRRSRSPTTPPTSTSRCRSRRRSCRRTSTRLRNYGSLFLGDEATVAYGDKAVGTNHVLPTAARRALHGRPLGRQVPQDLHVPGADAARAPATSRPPSRRSARRRTSPATGSPRRCAWSAPAHEPALVAGRPGRRRDRRRSRSGRGLRPRARRGGCAGPRGVAHGLRGRGGRRRDRRDGVRRGRHRPGAGRRHPRRGERAGRAGRPRERGRHEPRWVPRATTPSSDWDALFAVNVRATFSACQAFGDAPARPRRPGLDREPLVADGHGRLPRPRRLLLDEARRRGHDEGARRGVGAARHPRQRGRARRSCSRR